METYTFTIWLLWHPTAAGYRTSEIIRHIVESILECLAYEAYYTATLAADGVESIAVSCVQALGV